MVKDPTLASPVILNTVAEYERNGKHKLFMRNLKTRFLRKKKLNLVNMNFKI